MSTSRVPAPAAQVSGFRSPTYVVAGAGLVAALVAGSVAPPLALLPLAVVLGWSHLRSL